MVLKTRSLQSVEGNRRKGDENGEAKENNSEDLSIGGTFTMGARIR